MTEYEALTIESMKLRHVLCEPGIRLYERHNLELAMENEHRDARFAAILYVRLTEAIDLLKAKL